jgi:O-antigen ligase
MRKWVLATGAAALVCGSTVIAFYSGGFFDRPRIIGAFLVWLGVIVVALVAPRPLPASTAGRVALAGLLLLCVWTGLSIAWAPIGGRAQDDLQRLLLYLGFFVVAIALVRGKGARRWLEPGLALGAFVIVAYALSERLLPGLVELSRSRAAHGRLEQPITYWNALGIVAAIGSVLAVRIAGTPERPAALRAAAGAVAVPLLLGTYLTFARGALAALAVGMVMLLALAPAGRAQLRSILLAVTGGAVAAFVASNLHGIKSLEAGQQGDTQDGLIMLGVLVALSAVVAIAVVRAPRLRLPQFELPASRPRLVLAASVLVVVAAGVTVAAFDGKPKVTSPENSADPARLGSVDTNRYRYWEVALRSFGDNPIAGLGSGGFAVAWLKEKDRVDKSGDAHSLYLETAGELGIVGVAFLLMFLGGIVAGAVKLARLDRGAATGVVAGLGAWGCHAGLDWDWEMPATTLPALLLAAAAIAWSEELGGEPVEDEQAAELPQPLERAEAVPAAGPARLG